MWEIPDYSPATAVQGADFKHPPPPYPFLPARLPAFRFPSPFPMDMMV